MSLVGSLEDLGLADILQIVSLSRKSGMLALRSEGGDGRILLRDGLVQGAAIKGEADDLRSLLVNGGFVEGEAFDRARAAADAGEIELPQAIQRECGLPVERLDSLRRERVERAVMRMFSWRNGEFSFEIREEPSGDDDALLLPSGLNTQYLAMEASRLRDEHTRGPEAPAAPEDEEPVFSGEEPAAPPAEPADPVGAPAVAVAGVGAEDGERESAAVEALALASARHADASEIAEAEPLPDAEASAAPTGDAVVELEAGSEIAVGAGAPVADTSVQVSVGSAASAEPAAAPSVDAAAPPGPSAAAEPDPPCPAPGAPAAVEAPPPARVAAEPSRERAPRSGTTPARQAAHLVAIDADLSALEWLKASVEGLFRRVHIFQRSEIAVDRIRQYLVRGVIPLVVVMDHGSQEPEARALIQRLRSLAPTMPLLALRPDGASEEVSPELDGVVFRPSAPSSDPDRRQAHDAVAERLRADLEARLAGARSDTARRRARNALARLKHVSDRLRDPSTQGEVLTLVLEYAAETFSRVAMFMVRDDVAAGIAQLGLPPTGGPDDEVMRSLELGPDELPELFRRVLEERTAVRSALAGTLDRRLAMRLGAATPAEAYAAPIESGGCVVAIVYADNLPEERPIRDTTALEIVLHEAGLALDRALLERALAEREP